MKAARNGLRNVIFDHANGDMITEAGGVPLARIACSARPPNSASIAPSPSWLALCTAPVRTAIPPLDHTPQLIATAYKPV